MGLHNLKGLILTLRDSRSHFISSENLFEI